MVKHETIYRLYGIYCIWLWAQYGRGHILSSTVDGSQFAFQDDHFGGPIGARHSWLTPISTYSALVSTIVGRLFSLGQVTNSWQDILKEMLADEDQLKESASVCFSWYMVLVFVALLAGSMTKIDKIVFFIRWNATNSQFRPSHDSGKMVVIDHETSAIDEFSWSHGGAARIWRHARFNQGLHILVQKL